MTFSMYTRCALALSLLLNATGIMAQQATLIADDHDGIVIRFDFSDPVLSEVVTPEGNAIIPRVLGDSPLLRAGAPDLSKVDATVLIGAASGTALEVIDSEYTEVPGVNVAPSKGNLYRNVDPATVPFEEGAVYAQDGFFPAEAAALRTPFVERGCGVRPSGHIRSNTTP